MRAVLNNTIEINPLVVTGARDFLQNENRDCLTFVFPETSLDKLDDIFTEANCETISLFEEDGTENIHKGYVVRGNLTKKKVILQDATVDVDEISEMRCFVTMGQRTYRETKLAAIEAQSMDTAIAVAELGVMITGGTE